MKVIGKRLIKYGTSHIWCSLSFIIIVACILFSGISQIYLKKAFIEYLTNNTIHAEQSILASVTENIANSTRQLSNIGYEAATDDALYKTAHRIRQETQNTYLNLTLEEQLNVYAHYSPWVLGVCISDQDRILYQYDKKQKSTKIWDDSSVSILQEIASTFEIMMVTGEMPKIVVTTTTESYPDQGNQHMLHFSFPIVKRGTDNRFPIVVTITLNTKFLEDSLDQIYQSNEGVVSGYLVDEKGVIVYHTNKNYIGKYREDIIQEKDIMNLRKSVGLLGWTTFIDIDKNQLFHQVDAMYQKGLFMMLAATAFIIGILVFIIWKVILRPLRVVIQAISDTQEGKERTAICIKGKNEIWQVADEFNEMMISLEKSNQEVEQHYKDKVMALKKQRNAEREAMESQINAHFICNTINIINYDAIEAGNHKVSNLLKKLSNILRYTFEQKNQNVYFYQEILWVEQYLFLQKNRFEGMFEYTIQFNEKIQGWPCRKLMLQPFVENSIIHGFEGRKEGGFIYIEGKEIATDCIQIVIEDNGIGMNSETEKIVRYAIEHPYERNIGKVGIGISNVVARIFHYYGDSTRIELETKEGAGCKFTFTFYNQGGREE